VCEREERELWFTTTIRNKNSTERERPERESVLKERKRETQWKKKPRERGRDF
jgi:hypothetical protein